MKSVMLSIRPRWCELIANGQKTIEVRKTCPKLETPFKCYIYCTVSGPVVWVNEKPANGKVIGEFVCDGIKCFDVPYPAFQDRLDKAIIDGSCCTYFMLHRYAYHDALYGWHISDLQIYDEPRELGEYFLACDKPKGTDCSQCIDERLNRCKSITHPPQSWCYVEVPDGR